MAYLSANNTVTHLDSKMDTPAVVSAENIAENEESGLTYQTVADDINKYLGTIHVSLYFIHSFRIPTSTYILPEGNRRDQF